MTVNECPREDQIVQAVLSGAWPTRSDDELTAHASHCEVCCGSPDGRHAASQPITNRRDTTCACRLQDKSGGAPRFAPGSRPLMRRRSR